MLFRAEVPVDSITTARSIRVAKEYHKFSAAHFLIFPDGSAERLHGHNYRVSLELTARSLSHGMVLDFKVLKQMLSGILEELDERVLLPGRHPALICELVDHDALEVRHSAKRYVFPPSDVIVLPLSNTSSENLADWIAHSCWRSIRGDHPGVALERLEVSVEETPGQVGTAILHR